MPPNLYFDCGTCGKSFPAGSAARENHLRSTGHSMPANECDCCHRWFGTEQARDQHMRATGHYSNAYSSSSEGYVEEEEAEDDTYCYQCQRQFQNNNNLKMHLNSRVHRGRQIKCPFCSRLFTTAAGLAHHLESASCPNASGLGRDGLYRFVRSKDPQGLISKNLIEWTGSSHYEADSGAWNGNGYTTSTRPSTKQDLYHCPNPACRADFKTLAGIINHLESESCRFTKFEHVQQNINNIVSGSRRIAF
ncbi:hypothetical protein G6O67_003589 [Ophiocordyceps sinensis]|uniref:C2H2-type domain-containing protein n=1 Tax=Ophiocordyceps sinensis TaxID=72228 RepID=A0A8H4PS87_9HYPO|nr:hypothetical protein G6O67_003589 [Ophiocordyceps sinensis]